MIEIFYLQFQFFKKGKNLFLSEMKFYLEVQKPKSM